MDEKYTDKMIVDAWHKNVAPWITAIQSNEIASRVAVTNKAIVDAILEYRPEKVLDIGCGEGWLVRAMIENGIDCMGIDVVTDFINYAEAKHGRFKTLPYEEISYTTVSEKFDLLVCNFSLLGKESVEYVFQHAAELLHPTGTMIVQTLHPEQTSIGGSNTDGWREGSWQGFSGNFSDPAPWYFRTLQSWLALFEHAGFTQIRFTEPKYPATNRPASIIFYGSLA